MYLNKYDFLNQAVGIRSAARIYFGKEPKDLAIEESAMLVGMAKNPSMFNPIRFPERAKQRRNVVINQIPRILYQIQYQVSSVLSYYEYLKSHKSDSTTLLQP